MEQDDKRRSKSFVFSEVSAPGAVLAILLFLIIFYLFGDFAYHKRAARWPAAKSMCQRNLKECAVAVLLYCADYDDHLPSSALVRNSPTWNKQDFITFAATTGVLPVPEGSRAHTWPQLIYPYTQTRDPGDGFFCPKDESPHGSDGSRPSYFWKTAIDMAWHGEQCEKTYRRTEDFPYAGSQIMLYEHAPWHFKGEDKLCNESQINVVFLDGHVKTVSLRNATSGDPINCAANSNGEPMYFNCDFQTNTELPESQPATFIDPGRYGDKL